MIPLSAAPGTAATAASYVKEVTVQNFMTEVVQPSLQTPVLVYFTAPWCGPCKQFGPTLEKVVNEANGRFRLAKVDIDKSPQLAQQFRIQSVPMVYIFVQGQPIDGFAGAMPESQLKQLLAQFGEAAVPDASVQEMLDTAEHMLAEGDAQAAAQAFGAVLAAEEANTQALSGLVKCYLALGELEQAQSLLAQVPEALQSHESIVAVKTALALAQAAPKTATIAALQKAVAADEKNDQARYDLASALFVASRQEEAIDALLAIIRRNKDWNEGEAKAQLLRFFEALGHTHPLTMQGRRKLSTILFS
jgi:putative thioredoxin